jgi:hypothetical protein
MRDLNFAHLVHIRAALNSGENFYQNLIKKRLGGLKNGFKIM